MPVDIIEVNEQGAYVSVAHLSSLPSHQPYGYRVVTVAQHCLFSFFVVVVHLSVYLLVPLSCSFFLFVCFFSTPRTMSAAWALVSGSTHTPPVGFTCGCKSKGLLHGPSLQTVPNVVCRQDFMKVSL